MKVSVEVLFSSNSKLGSRIIACGTAHLAPTVKEKVSHTALLINSRWVHESTGHTGVRIVSYDKWRSTQTEKARIKLADQEYQQLADHFRTIQGKKYDYAGIIFFCIAILPTFIGFKLPKKNLLESKRRYFCCEVLGKLTGHYYGMSAPIQILERLRAS
jgi:hypothetical protein